MTFQRAFERAGTFNCNGNLDQGYCARTFQWLASISKNLKNDWFKRISEEHPLPLTSIMIPDHQVVHVQEETVPRRYVRLPEDADENLPDPHAGEKFIGNDDEVLLTISPGGPVPPRSTGKPDGTGTGDYSYYRSALR